MGRNLKTIDELKVTNAYEIIKDEKLDEINSLGILLRHKKTGARIVVISNEDENKVFSIGFRTPPKDSTGVAHIIEHSVLCGSKEFPAKDPFVELVKGSLNTFLNAMTYPDKTVYPIASCNEKDFQNLMHVYMDAVFYPNIYQREEIFKQEGWHYELETKDAPLTYNGVVYNEMKGVFSSPEQQLYRLIQQSLLPDTAYGVESGGDPTFIPDLTYQDFLEFHKAYYHPSNSFIYLYGNMDVEEKLEWMDSAYLDKFQALQIDSTIKKQKTFEKMVEKEQFYSIAEGESTVDKTYLSYNAIIGDSLDESLYLAFQVIEYVLLSSPGAPLKQALIDAGIGKDVSGSYDNGILQPIFSIVAKNTEIEKKEKFIQIIRSTLQEIVENGLQEKALRAAINYYEFKYKEADFGPYPKGLMYGLQLFDSWLYDDQKPFIHIKTEKTFHLLKEKIGTGYYEGLIQSYLLNNTHTSLVIVKPKVGLTAMLEDETSRKLAAYKEGLSEKELEQLVLETKALKQYQEEPSTKEELEKIPLLTREDIDTKAQPLYNEEKEIANCTVLHHNLFTNGIAYIKAVFDVSCVEEEKIPYMSLLATVLGYIDTKKQSFLDFSNEVNIHTGGITSDVRVYALAGKPEEYIPKFEIRTKVLYDEVSTAFALFEEMLYESKIEDEKRLLEIIQELVSRLEVKIVATGNSFAATRAMSYYSKYAKYNDLVGGISYYYFLKDLAANFEEKKQEIVVKLREVLTQLLRKDKVMYSLTCDEQGYQCVKNEIEKFTEKLSTDRVVEKRATLKLEKRNEGFKTSSQVQYVSRAGNFLLDGFAYTGALRILKVILSYDYLWLNVRVKGGAYGCMSGFGLDGNSYFASYRDPNLSQTNDIFEHTVDYVSNFEVEERDMTKYIIGTISSMDTPLTPSAKGARSFSAYMSGVSEEDIQREREEVLSAGVEEIRGLAPIVKSVLEQKNICVIGNETKIEEEKQLFEEVKTL